MKPIRLRELVRRGSRADQLSAADVAEGAIYYVTDENVTERSNGSAWEDISDAGDDHTIYLDLDGSRAMTGDLDLGSIGQITFPATQNPSSGANVLDDYEEGGSWTPAMEFGGATTGITYGTQAGSYVKVGRLVWVKAQIALTSKGSATGTAKITGFPFTTESGGQYQAGGVIGAAYTMSSLTSAVVILMDSAATTGILRDWGSTGTTVVSDANFNDTSSFHLSFCYYATD